MICNDKPSHQIDKSVDGREADWTQKGCLLSHTHTKHCSAPTRHCFVPSALGKDSDTQLRFTGTLLPAPVLSWEGGGKAVRLGALGGSGSFPGPAPCSLMGQPPEEPPGVWGCEMDQPCVGEAALTSRTVSPQGPAWWLHRKVSEVLSPS